MTTQSCLQSEGALKIHLASRLQRGKGGTTYRLWHDIRGEASSWGGDGIAAYEGRTHCYRNGGDGEAHAVGGDAIAYLCTLKHLACLYLQRDGGCTTSYCLYCSYFLYYSCEH